MALPPVVLMELQYLPPVQYFTKFLLFETIYLEQQEHYAKGSYRNRCYIAGPNGILRLSIPLLKGKNEGQAIREVRIAYHEPWPSRHWSSICTAYGNAPYFPYYADIFQPFYQRRYTFLFDFTHDLLQTTLTLLQIGTRLEWTGSYLPEETSGIMDLRDRIAPKNEPYGTDPFFQPVPYPQVFEEKHRFLPNLSILDLLFCTGPQAISILEASIRYPKNENK